MELVSEKVNDGLSQLRLNGSESSTNVSVPFALFEPKVTASGESPCVHRDGLL